MSVAEWADTFADAAFGAFMLIFFQLCERDLLEWGESAKQCRQTTNWANSAPSSAIGKRQQTHNYENSNVY
jgi:hypothetical protein